MSDELSPDKEHRRGLYVTSETPSDLPGGSVVRKPGLMRDLLSWGQRGASDAGSSSVS